MAAEFSSQTSSLSVVLPFLDTDRQHPRAVVLRAECQAELEEPEVFTAIKNAVQSWVQNSGEGKEALFCSGHGISVNDLIGADLDSPAFRRALNRQKIARLEVVAVFGLMTARDATAALTAVDN